MSEDEIIKMIMESVPQQDWTDGESYKVFKSDVNLRIEQTNEDSELDDKFGEPWVKTAGCPDPNAYKVDVAIYYGSTKIKDIHLVTVDGFRAIVPIPENISNLQITDMLALKIAQILSENCDEYITRCGLKV